MVRRDAWIGNKMLAGVLRIKIPALMGVSWFDISVIRFR